MDDTRPFPIQSEGFVRGKGRLRQSTIPWWLAEIAYEHYHSLYPEQTLERLAKRGGFGRNEIVNLIRREKRR